MSTCVKPASYLVLSLPRTSKRSSDGSTYDKLSRPLVCEWLQRSSGLLCSSAFTEMEAFFTHVREEHVNQSSDLRHCQWRACSFEAESPDNFSRHLLFHVHHSYQKLLGSEYVAKMPELPPCQAGTAMSNLVPDLEEELRCLWRDCEAVFDCVAEFYRHLHSHAMEDTEVKCQWKDCSFQAARSCKLRDHTRSHTHEKTVACPTCGSLFVNNTKLQDHLTRQIDPSDPSLACTFCHKCFQSERILREHIRKHVNSLKCPHCELTCNAPSRLLSHIRHRHIESKPHSCLICHKKFKTAILLGEHIESHRDKTIQCSVAGCEYLARSKKTMQMHLRRIHQPNLRLYSCHVCSERYNMGKKLTAHLKLNHGFSLPPGHCRFRYVAGLDGLKRLQTVRLDDENVVTPEVSTISESPSATP